MDNYKFIKLNKNTKTPINGQFFKVGTKDKGQTKDKINTSLYNIGLLAEENNLLIVDIDIKDGGMMEWNEYTKEHSEPYTMKQKTASGGYHYIFKHHDETYTEEQNEIIDQLRNKAKYRNKGIDIRKGNAYIVFEPSTIDDNSYRLQNRIEPQKMPLKLLKWLVAFEVKEKEAINNNLVLISDGEELKLLLDNFNGVSSKMWHYITISLKNVLHPYNKLHEKVVYEMWDNWSKQQDGYNKKGNIKKWETLPADINLNFVITQHNKTTDDKLILLKSFKPIEQEIISDVIPTIKMNNKFIYDKEYTGPQYTEETINEYDTIIIKSTTGTGKTSNTARHIENIIKDKPLKFMSIISLITMSNQHMNSFKNINIKSYQDKETNKEDDNIVICLNSLVLYQNYNGAFFKNYVVYIDEINSIINSLTHNKLLDKVLKSVYIVLMKILNNAYKVIVSDATINKNVFELLKKRSKVVYIENTFKKYEGVNIIKYNDENEFYKEVLQHVKDRSYFLFGSDSKDKADKYKLSIEPHIKNKEQLRSFTSDTNKKEKVVIDATEEFEEHFIIFSPTITTGVDNNNKVPQDAFLYINGLTITPDASFQQLTRTRNIKNAYVFINDIDSKTAKYNKIEDIKEQYNKHGLLPDKVLNMCCSVDDNNEWKFNDNDYFKLFSYNEYLLDTYETNKEQHFKNIVLNNGFIITERGDKKQLKIKIKKKMKDVKELNEEMTFLNHIEHVKEHDNYKKRIELLEFVNNEQVIKYKELIKDNNLYNDYLNLMKLIRTEDNNKFKCTKETKETTQYKAINSTCFKISLLWSLEKELKIKRFELNKLDDDKPCKINDELIKNINISFRCSKCPTTYNEYIEYYAHKLQHIAGSIKIITSEQKQIKGKRQRYYIIDKDVLNEYLKINEISNPSRKNIIKSDVFYKSNIEAENEQRLIDYHKETLEDIIEEAIENKINPLDIL